MVHTKKQGGFTVIEVTIFVAISGLLLSVALLGTGGTIRSVRFSDSVRSLQSYFQTQYDQIINGVNPRTGQEVCQNSLVNTSSPAGQAPGTSNCLLLGKYLHLAPGSDTVQSYYVVGSEPASVPTDLSDEELIKLYNPHIVTQVDTDVYAIPWGATISDTRRLEDSHQISGYALLRSPRSAKIISYTFSSQGVSDSLNGVISDAANIQKATNICIKSADNFGNPAKITIAAGQGQDAITFGFEATTDDCQGVTPS
ncbi:MAG TPA: prepilin-type N-terminal cleavage/methylation domain-containing protein [Candidatus Saccharimonadales bacterium]|jgi:type II secretory pathway pseudopilin PulG|nr:prepilin-type N-terminal cleavage/methylation domain-containing protein [Candidatus Saccharimonadales bacterium]